MVYRDDPPTCTNHALRAVSSEGGRCIRPVLRGRRRVAAVVAGLGVLLASFGHARAYDSEYSPLVLKVGDDTLVRFIAWTQVWTRLIENNPGTSVQGSAEDISTDIGIRRAHFLALGKISDDVLLMFHIGINNQTFRNNVFQGAAPEFYVHDAWTEFKLTKSDAFSLYAGAGLLYWNGISRMTNTSTLNLLVLDAPITNWPTINGSDQFARQLGWYFKGRVAGGLIDYRLAIVRPFVNDAFTPTTQPNTWATSSYTKLQFLDPESDTLPYHTGTYLGKKRVFNVGFGHHLAPGRQREHGGRLGRHAPARRGPLFGPALRRSGFGRGPDGVSRVLPLRLRPAAGEKRRHHGPFRSGSGFGGWILAQPRREPVSLDR